MQSRVIRGRWAQENMADWTPGEGFLKKLLIWGTFEDTQRYMEWYNALLQYPSVALTPTDPRTLQESSGFDPLFLEHSWFASCLGSRPEQPLV